MIMRCRYCKNYLSSLKKFPNSDRENIRRCMVAKKDITFESDSCEYYNPDTYFYCDTFNERYSFLTCLARRFNKSKLESFKQCLGCRQFGQAIQFIIKKYFIDADPILDPPPPRRLTIKRRKGSSNDKKTSSLKVRRKKSSNHRSLRVKRPKSNRKNNKE